MPSTTTPDGWPDFLRRLQEILEDPQVKRLAWRRAEDPDLAQDALQETFYVIARTQNPDQIRDLRAYFCTVLIRQVYRLRGQLGAALVDDLPGVADARRAKTSDAPPPAEPFDQAVDRHQLARSWLKRIAAERPELTRGVPGRSPDPSRYRDFIVTVAQRWIVSFAAGDASEPGSSPAGAEEYREWFAEAGCEPANLQQRSSRARADVGALLRVIIGRDDLYS